MLWKWINVVWDRTVDPEKRKRLLLDGVDPAEADAQLYGEAATERGPFNIMSTCVTGMIQRLMAPVRNDRFHLLTISCDSYSEETSVSCYDGYCQVSIPWDLSGFYDLDDYQKKKVIVDIVEAGLDVLEANGIVPVASPRKACAIVREVGYQSIWVVNEKRSASKLKASAIADSNTERLLVWLYVFGKGGQMMGRFLMAETGPEMVHVRNSYAKSMAWTGEALSITSEDGFGFAWDPSFDCPGFRFYEIVPRERAGAIRLGMPSCIAGRRVGALAVEEASVNGLVRRQVYEGVELGFDDNQKCTSIVFGAGSHPRLRGAELIGLSRREVRALLVAEGDDPIDEPGLVSSPALDVSVGFEGAGEDARAVKVTVS